MLEGFGEIRHVGDCPSLVLNVMHFDEQNGKMDIFPQTLIYAMYQSTNQALGWIGIGNSVLIAVKRWTQVWIREGNSVDACPLYTDKGPSLVQMAMLIAGVGTCPDRHLKMEFIKGIKTGPILSVALRVIYALSHLDNFKAPPNNETPPVGLMPLTVSIYLLNLTRVLVNLP